jgi:hypothetical protein
VKLTRDTFLYLHPRTRSRFAQCATCRDWVLGDRRCVIHGPKVRVLGTASCGLYVFGWPNPAGTKTSAKVTPEESGLVNRQVRCENCTWADDGAHKCGFYELLNKELGDVFDLDVNIDPHGCCNAQQPPE